MNASNAHNAVDANANAPDANATANAVDKGKNAPNASDACNAKTKRIHRTLDPPLPLSFVF